jgi:hypothetical protein
MKKIKPDGPNIQISNLRYNSQDYKLLFTWPDEKVPKKNINWLGLPYTEPLALDATNTNVFYILFEVVF